MYASLFYPCFIYCCTDMAKWHGDADKLSFPMGKCTCLLSYLVVCSGYGAVKCSALEIEKFSILQWRWRSWVLCSCDARCHEKMHPDAVQGHTWNLSWRHWYCPCKSLPTWGKIGPQTYIVCYKLIYFCNTFLFLETKWAKGVILGEHFV